MAVVNKGEVKKPSLPKKTVEVASLGGDVVVHGLTLAERMRIFCDQDAAGSETDVSMLLAITVRDAEGKHLFTQEEWEIFGANPDQFIDCLKLFNEAKELSGLSVEVAKKN